MVNNISSVASSLVYHNISTLYVQTQDPWLTFSSQVLAVIVGGIIALIANLALQMHSFDIQGRIFLMNQRMAAYSDLLHDISLYDASSYMSEEARIHGNKAALYGSPIVEAKLQPWLQDLEFEAKVNFGAYIYDIGNYMEAEIRTEKLKTKSWWQFWR